MENYIQNIELINQYLNKSLSENESISFLNRLKSESEFNKLYKAHLLFLEGLKRQTLKGEIIAAKQHYVTIKWFKYLGISVAIVVISILAYILLFSNTTVGPKPIPENNSSIIISDSIPSKDGSDKKAILKDTLSSIKKETIEEIMVSSEKAPKKEKLNLESLKKAPQFFAVDSKKDTTIVCKEGTKLIIKASTFVDANNRKVEGKINIAVTEYYKLSDMLLANLTTTSDGEQLETGGMLFIEAKKDNAILKLAQNSSVEILFPAQNKKDSMQLFFGERKDGIINWKLQNKIENNVEVKDIEIVEVEEGVEVPFSIVEEVPLFPGCEKEDKIQQKTCTSNAITNHVQRNFNINIAEKLDLKGRLRVTTLFKINENGDVANIRSRGVHPEIEEEANRVIGLLPRMLPGKQRGNPVMVSYGLPILLQIDGGSGNKSTIRTVRQGIIPIADSIINVNFENSLKNETNVRASRVNSYILRTLNLGWINCDRFINGRTQTVKYRLKVNDGNGAVVSMIFKSINSVLPSQNINGIYNFGTVSKDENVFLVAIKKEDEKLYLDIIETKTDENPDLKFNFKEVTIQEMKNELQKLNKFFE